MHACEKTAWGQEKTWQRIRWNHSWSSIVYFFPPPRVKRQPNIQGISWSSQKTMPQLCRKISLRQKILLVLFNKAYKQAMEGLSCFQVTLLHPTQSPKILKKTPAPTKLNLHCLASNQKLPGIQRCRKSWPITRRTTIYRKRPSHNTEIQSNSNVEAPSPKVMVFVEGAFGNLVFRVI